MLARLRLFSLWSLLAVLPLQWIVLGRPFGLSIKPAHIAVPLIVASFLSLPDRMAALARFTRSHKTFVVAVYLYFVLVLSSALWAPDPAIPVREAIKLAAHFAVFVATAITISSLNRRQLARAITTAIPVGLLSFLGLAMLAFASLGRNLFTAYLSAVSDANVRQLQFGFYPAIFGDGSPTSLRNTLVAAFVVYAVLMLGVRTTRRRARRLVAASAILLVLLSVSRSNILALVIACTAAMVLSAASNDQRIHRKQLPVMAFLGLGLFVLLLVGQEYLLGMATAVTDRFSSVQAGDSRLAMYGLALEQIGSQPLLGYGAGHEIAIGNSPLDKTFRVHNLFLASWLELGVGGLILSMVLYGYVIVLCVLNAKWIRTASSTAAGISPAWLIGLAALPLVRSLISGDGGQFTFIEWFALSVFFGLCRAKGSGSRRPGGDHPEPHRYGRIMEPTSSDRSPLVSARVGA